MRKRLLSLLLAALMVIGLLPAAAFAADGDTAPTATLPDGTACTVTDTGLSAMGGEKIYKTTVPGETASITVDWAVLKENVGKYVQEPSVACAEYTFYETYNGTPVTVPLAGHNDEESFWDITAEQIAQIKSDASHSLVILTLAWAGSVSDAPTGCVLCVEIGEKSESGESIDPAANTAPTLREGVKATGNKKAGYEGIAWELDLSTIFTDADGDTLTYKVSIDGADAVAADEQYSYTCGTDNVVFVFTANDGKDDSDKTYTVTMTANKKPVLKAESGSGEIATGETISLAMSTFFSGNFQDYWVSVDGGEEEYIGNNRVTFTSLAYEKPGVHTFVFRAGLDRVPYSDPCTYTLTVTGEEITNHTPYLLDTAAAEAPTEPMWTAGTNTNWRPDLTKVFADEDGYDTLSFTYRDDLMENFSKFHTGSTQPGYAVGGVTSSVGERTVTIRATDPFGAYVDYTVQITVKLNHAPVKKADAPDTLSVFVPVGLTYRLNGNDYYTDEDEKDVGNIQLVDKRYNGVGSYKATTVGDTTTVTVYGSDGATRCNDAIEVTFTAIAINEEKTFGVDEPYTLNTADLGLAGNLKVRVNAGAEQTIEGDTFAYTGSGVTTLHFYSDKTATAADNYVVKITWPKDAPTVKIGDTAYEVQRMDAESGLDVYKVVVPADFEKLAISGYSQGYVQCYCGNVDTEMPCEISNHTCGSSSFSQQVDASCKYICAYIYDDSDNYEAKLLIQLGESSAAAFAPAIGNGSAAGTTADGVTTFPAGTGSAAPTVTLTAPASGWAVGENTFTVSCEKACVVVLKSGDTYTKLTAVNSGDAHSFTATLAEGDEIIVRLKGDVNGDGAINTTDAGLAKAASLNKGSLSGLNLVCAMVSGGTSVKITDAGQIKAASLNKLTFSW